VKILLIFLVSGLRSTVASLISLPSLLFFYALVCTH